MHLKAIVFMGIMYVLSSLPSVVIAQQKQPEIAFTADTQEPIWFEKLYHKHGPNLKATQLIFNDVDALRPAAFFILGDVVSLAKSDKAWINVDRYLGQLKKDGIRVYATLGNHEVMFNAEKGKRNFKVRFPMYVPTGYVEVIDSVAVVMLDSNFGKMSAAVASGQNQWYQTELRKLDDDPAIKLIIVGCHHSPYTNSRVVSPSVPVQQNFVPPFTASKKCVLFLSGHSHNFERFSMQGKDFVVIGGGGGLYQGVRSNNGKMQDLAANYKPAFHYLQVKRQGDTLLMVSKKLKADMSGFDDGVLFEAYSNKGLGLAAKPSPFPYPPAQRSN